MSTAHELPADEWATAELPAAALPQDHEDKRDAEMFAALDLRDRMIALVEHHAGPEDAPDYLARLDAAGVLLERLGAAYRRAAGEEHMRAREALRGAPQPSATWAEWEEEQARAAEAAATSPVMWQLAEASWERPGEPPADAVLTMGGEVDGDGQIVVGGNGVGGRR